MFKSLKPKIWLKVLKNHDIEGKVNNVRNKSPGKRTQLIVWKKLVISYGQK